MRRVPLILLVSLASIFICGEVFAINTHFSPILQWQPIGSRDYLGSPSSRILFPGQFSLGLSQYYGRKPLSLEDAAGTGNIQVLDNAFWQLLQVGVGIAPGWQLGVTAPWAVASKFDDPTSTTRTGNYSSMFGDIRITSRLRMLNPDKKRVGLAVEPFVTVPTGRASRYFGEDSVSGGTIAMLDWQIDPKWQVGFRTGVEVRPQITFRNADFSSRSFFGVNGQYKLKRFISLHLEAQGYTPWKHFFSEELTPLEVQGGISWEFRPGGIQWRLAAGSCVLCGIQGSRGFGWLGLEYRFKTERLDRSQRQADFSRFLLFRKKISWSVVSLRGECPEKQEDYDPMVHDPGCAKVYEMAETAVLLGKCPTNPEEFDPAIHDESCPKVFTLGETFTEEEREQIYALRELQKEPVPMKEIDLVKIERRIFAAPIYFEFNKSNLKETSRETLKIVAKDISAHPTLKSVTVEGHSDGIGTERRKRKISEERVRTVIDFLRKEGVPDRIELIGKPMSDKKPAVPNVTEEGRALNRRIRFYLGY